MIFSLVIFVTFLISCFLISSVNIGRYSRFESALISLIYLISIFAVSITKGCSVFVFPLLFISYTLIDNRRSIKWVLNSLNDWISIIFIFFLFYFIFFVLPGFVLAYPHEDYLIYERIAHYNYEYGVENTRTFYNAISDNQPRVELYHYFEIWGAKMISIANGMNFLDNFILVLCPLMVFISWLGIKELLNKNEWIPLFIIFSIFLFINPYDYLVRTFKLPFPITGLGGVINSLKYLFVIPILIYSLIQIEKSNTKYFRVLVVSFLYLLVFPVLLVSFLFYDIINKRVSGLRIIIPIFLGLIFYIFVKLLDQGAISSEINFLYFIDYSISFKILIIGVFFPFLIFIFLKFVLGFKYSKNHVLFFMFNALVGSFMWIIHFDNIDANQLYRNSLSPFFSLLIFINLETIDIKWKFRFIIFISLFVFAAVVSSLQKVSLSPLENRFLNYIENKNRVLFIPDSSYVKSVYQFNERLNFKYLKIFYYKSDIDIINFVSLYSIPNRVDTNLGINMILQYKSLSPLLDYCQGSNVQDSCIVSYAKEVNVDLIVDERK